jgi:hypothetical protein
MTKLVVGLGVALMLFSTGAVIGPGEVGGSRCCTI